MCKKPLSRLLENPIKNSILIAGPTGCGKSSLAFELAVSCGGVIINTDSMQIYDTLKIITAHPEDCFFEAIPHFLYGYVPCNMAYSTGLWARDVLRLIKQNVFGERVLIFTGGTGLYFRALTKGLVLMPDIPLTIRNYWRSRLLEEGAASLYKVLEKIDCLSASQLNPSDGQRIVRALEVFDSSNRSLFSWKQDPSFPIVDLETANMFVIDMDRELLRQRIRSRLDSMVKKGVLEEIKNFLDKELDSYLPIRKAIGVEEFCDVITKGVSLEDSIEKIELKTWHYAKRQLTWFRNQCGPEWRRIKGDEKNALKNFMIRKP